MQQFLNRLKETMDKILNTRNGCQMSTEIWEVFSLTKTSMELTYWKTLGAVHVFHTVH